MDLGLAMLLVAARVFVTHFIYDIYGRLCRNYILASACLLQACMLLADNTCLLHVTV